MINIKNLNLNFGEKKIFENAAISIPERKITMLVGSNGIGKTTLFRIITGEQKVSEKVENSFKKIFYLPQKLFYPKNMTTFDYVSTAYFKNNWKWFLNKEEKNKVLQILEKVELSGQKDISTEKLSSGELQKANIAIGLLSDADVFLLDEPVSNLDLVNRIKILNLLKALTKSGITPVIIMHDLNLAAAYGEYFIGLGKNNKIVQGAKEEFFNKENLKSIYDIGFDVVKNEDKFYIQIID